MGNRIGLLKLALMMALGGHTQKDESGWSERDRGNAMLNHIRTKYRGAGGRKASGAAGQKRASRHARNIAKHCRAARGH